MDGLYTSVLDWGTLHRSDAVLTTISFLLPAAGASAAVLVVVEILKLNRLIRIIKPFATTLVIAVAATGLFRGYGTNNYTALVVLGLFLSLGGDISLMPPDRDWKFRVGLLFFLSAHLVYIAAFWPFAAWTRFDILTLSILTLAAVGFYLFIRKNLGTMKLPVIVYMAVICLMVNRALATGSPYILTGAVLFFVSDLMLAFSRFRTHWKYERISLVFYYSGQLLLAFSASGTF
jgi:uncharacterized membrane protein YhhN